MYLSVSDAAKKFNVSRRRVQTLCEQGRIVNATRVSGVWLIPQTAQKPFDARRKINRTSLSLTNSANENDALTIKDVCKIFSISVATVKNWIRLGKIIPKNNKYEFDRQYINDLFREIKSGTNSTLKNRRNKSFISGSSIYKDYIQNVSNISVVENIVNNAQAFSEKELRVILSNFAIQFYYQVNNIFYDNGNVLHNFLNTFDHNNIFYRLIIDLLAIKNFEFTHFEYINRWLEQKLSYSKNEDTLGFLYISLRDLGQRKADGAYYTPKKIVDSLTKELFENYKVNCHTSIMDPCCGSGNFIISLLNNGVAPKNLFANDIDEIGIQLTRINVFLISNMQEENILYKNFSCKNTLLNKDNKKFDIILGNPPWGFNFSSSDLEKLKESSKIMQSKKIDSYDLFIEKTYSMLNPDGFLSFILPESILNVDSHKPIRNLIQKNFDFKYVNFLGNVFSNVQCPSIFIGITLKKSMDSKCIVTIKNNSFTINNSRLANSSTFNFYITDENNNCLETISSIKNAVYLKNNADFALGIVTGNNKKYITDKKNNKNERILKGADIFKYNVSESENYITFIPENFQQIAPLKMYRAEEKILYRFICETPVFAYDNKQTLSLNSCNILIPKIKGLSVKYILAILNSSVVSYYVFNKFKSIKLLRSHIEQIPIPYVEKDVQLQLEILVDKIINSHKNIQENFSKIDNIIMELYNLNHSDKELIKREMQDKKQFLLFE